MKKIFFLIFMVFLSSFALAGFSEAGIILRNSNTIPSSLTSGDVDAILQFDVYHWGTRTYNDINITGEFNQPFEPVREKVNIPAMHPGSTHTIVLRFNVGEADPGVYTVPIGFSYIDSGTSNKVIVKKNVYLQVSSEAKIEIKSMNSENAFVGEGFFLNFEIENIGQIPVSAVQASVVMENSSIITWVPSSKEISFISPSSSEVLSFHGFISRKAKHGSYSGVLTLNYGGKPIENNFVLDLMGKPKIEIAGVNTDEEPNPGKKIMLSIQLENTGTGDAKSTKVVIMPEGSAVGVFDSYIGTIESEDTGTAIFDVTLSEVGLNQIPILISFLDERGDYTEFKTSISVYNYPKPADKRYYLIILALAAAVFYFFRKRKQKRGKKI